MQPETNEEAYARMLVLLSRSRFRSRFHLGINERQYIFDKGWDTIRRHAEDFVAKRLAPSVIPNDGRQTPMRGHPVFIAQHATACCCRGCLRKWHGIPEGRALSDEEISAIAALLLGWIRAHAAGAGELPHTPDLF